MPRTVTLAVPPQTTDPLIADLEKINGLIGLQVQKSASRKPSGDVLTLVVLNRDIRALMLLLERRGLLSNADVSISTSQPLSVISKSASTRVLTDVSETTWEEMQGNINRDSEMTLNSLLTMFLAGVLATAGILTNTLHIVIGAMVIAPGFGPIVRVSLGLVNGHRDWLNGALDLVKAYAVLIVSAMATALLLRSWGINLDDGDAKYLPAGVLMSYWTTIDATSVLITCAGGLAGAVVVATNRSVLTAGVMIALALVPSATITGIGLVDGDMPRAGMAAFRLVMETGIVAAMAALLFAWKRFGVQKRAMSS